MEQVTISITDVQLFDNSFPVRTIPIKAVLDKQLDIIPNNTIVRISAPDEVGSGTRFHAQVMVDDVVDLDSGQLDIEYPADRLTILDVSDGKIGETIIPVAMREFEPPGVQGTIRILLNVPGVPGVSGSGRLCGIYFQVN